MPVLLQFQVRTYYNLGLLHGLGGFSYSLKSRTRNINSAVAFDKQFFTVQLKGLATVSYMMLQNFKIRNGCGVLLHFHQRVDLVKGVALAVIGEGGTPELVNG